MAIVAMLFAAPSAHATFHLMSIREVYPGSSAAPDSGYVELQMYAGGQSQVGGHAVTVYDAGGTTIGSFAFGSNVANAANQQTILIGDSGVQSAFGVAPDLVDAGLEIRRDAGAACWAGSIDCVSWGNFAGVTPSAAGTPADGAGIPDGKALRRTIEPKCPTLLEAADDSNASATDFADATPEPRNDASAIVEKACTGPAATIDSKPKDPTNQTAASFTYHSTPSGATFECKLDSAIFAACEASGMEYAGPLADGLHIFRVRGQSGGFLGATASYSWHIDTQSPQAFIDTHPADPSPGATASFAYHAGESGAKFECSLAAGAAGDAFSNCASSGTTYSALADGEYTFKVRAIDTAGNQGTPAAFSWTVDNTVPDTTPPQTTILSRPPDPSESPAASFTYESNEPGSSFECGLDGTAFASCPATGIAYSGLGDGSHTFLVRAIDPSSNVDPTPAGYTFAVVLPASVPGSSSPAAALTPLPAIAPLGGPAASPPRRRRSHCHRRRHGATHASRSARHRCRRHGPSGGRR